MDYGLKELKEDYGRIAEEYKLPSFEDANRNFNIEKIDRKSEILIRAVRVVMMEKVINILNFLEMFMNPVQVPRMYHLFVNSITNEDKKLIDKIYSSLAELVIDSLQCEIKYDEKKEAEIINGIFKNWSLVSIDLEILLGKIRKPNKLEKKERSYFG